MKKIFTLVFLYSLFLTPHSLRAQTYENSWINFNQKYFKVKVWQTGLYRITAAQLSANGISGSFPFNDTRRVQLFYNGQEQYIYVYDANGNNLWDPGDYIEFFGQRNDGSLDSRMYTDPTKMPNPNYSLFTDTASYYLTANPSSVTNHRVTVVSDTATYTSPAPYFIKESYAEFPSGYNYGFSVTGSGLGGSDHEYDEGEGWVGDQFSFGAPVDIQLGTQNIYSSGTNAVFQSTIVGTGGVGAILPAYDHNVRIRSTSPNYIVLDTAYDDYRLINPNESFPVSKLNSSVTTFEYSVTKSPVTTDFNSIGYARLTYPHTFQMENASTFKMWVPDNPGGKSYLDMTQFSIGTSSTAALWDTSNHKLIYVTINGNELKANVPNDGRSNPKFCFLATDSAISSMPFNIEYINHSGANSFTNFLPSGIDSAFIIITSKKLWNEASQYLNYRNQTTGNKAMLIDVDELYDQFSYGIAKHPLAIKNFAHFILDKWTGNPYNLHPPQAILLLGKGLAASNFRTSGTYFDSCYVPSYGEPCSDILLMAGINGTIDEPAIPIGRIAAKTGENVTDYLSKVKQYEDSQSVSPAPFWMKEVLHFGGGGDVNEQTTFRGYLNNYASIITDTFYGAHVDSFYSNSGQIITLSQSAQLHSLIDGGVSIMTFFGHGSTVTFDQDIGDPEIYNNYGRYPMLIANSCFAGDIFGTGGTKSEDFVLIPGKGSIAYLASTAIGFSSYLNVYTNALYQKMATTMYGKPMGAIIKSTIHDIQSSDVLTKQTCFEMTWHGDPLIRPNAWPKPDFSVTQPDISFTPQNITTDLDTFNVHVLLKNVGNATTDSFNVYIRRDFPDGTDSIYTVRTGSLFSQNTINLNLKMNSFKAAGLNKFTVTVNLPDTVQEMQYTNNIAATTIFISSSDIIPIYPPKYAIQPYNTVTLKASTVDPFAVAQNYRFEIDTTGDFNSVSTVHKTYLLNSAGGVLQWVNSIQPLHDTTVYFWRVANDSIKSDTIHFKWHTSSFIYIPNKTGWSQAHIHQFDSDGYNGVVYNRPARRFDFLKSIGNLICTTVGTPLNQNDYFATQFTINGSLSAGDLAGCGQGPKLIIAAIDSLTLTAWSNNNVNYGQLNQFPLANCLPHAENDFQFRFIGHPEEIDSAVSMLTNRIPVNDYILVYTFENINLSNYPNLVSALQSLGSIIIPTLGDVPYIFFIKKGSPSTMREISGASTATTITLNAQMNASWYFGTVTSELVGPASNWTSLHWQSHATEQGSTRDSIALSILGIQNSGKVDTLVTGIAKSTVDYSLASISAATYPYLQLVAYMRDDSLRTPPQLDRWQVYYKGLPEAALNPNRLFSFHNYTMDEGDTVSMSIAIDNIADLPMDSLNVLFYLFDNNRVQHNISSQKLDSLRVGKSLTASVKFSSLGFSGNNALWVEANPLNAKHQPEQYHFNNIGQVKFKVNKDVINPILDVTFDGVHILDGDIISAKPIIIIQLHDENKFLALNDTSKFRLYLTTPSLPLHQIFFHDSVTKAVLMRFTPAVLPNNSCRIDYNPVFSEDGKYQLQVEATDASLNESGKYAYMISFEVVNKSTITEVMNYPNPFSTSTRFVFTLTGSQIPTHFRIRIMTISGKVIREIMTNELGNIHIGRNITDYAWDGKDQYGDQLANGLYLYQVTTDINGQTIEHMNTEADSFFKKGWGKMYLLR